MEIFNKVRISKFFFLFLLVFFSLSLVSAQSETFQFNKQFDLKRACFDRGGFCGAGFACNITLIYPDGDIVVQDVVMTNNGSFRNVTITQGQNNQLGIWEAIESCANATNAGADTFQIYITADGLPFQNFPIQFAIIIFAFVLVGVGHMKDSLRLFQTAGSMLMLILGVLTLYPGYSFINYSTFLGQSLGIILIGLAIYFLIEHNFSRDKQEDKFEHGPSE